MDAEHCDPMRSTSTTWQSALLNGNFVIHFIYIYDTCIHSHKNGDGDKNIPWTILIERLSLSLSLRILYVCYHESVKHFKKGSLQAALKSTPQKNHNNNNNHLLAAISFSITIKSVRLLLLLDFCLWLLSCFISKYQYFMPILDQTFIWKSFYVLCLAWRSIHLIF